MAYGSAMPRWRSRCAALFLSVACCNAGLAQADPAESLRALEQLFGAVEIAAHELPRDTFDPQAIVDGVGTNPEELFAWVRDNTVLVPYKGVLRGPIGVLMDRRGNSLDRALLLRELLRLAGHDALLATGTLTPQEARELLAAWRGAPADRSASTPESVEELLERVIVEAGLEPTDWLAALETEQSQVEAQQQRLLEESSRQSEFLLNAVAPFSDSQDEAESLAARLLEEHWWVEIQTTTNIIDLDPSYADARVSETITEPLNRFSPETINQLRGLADTGHTLVVRVIVESWHEGALHEEVVLEHELFPAELYGRRLALGHVLLGAPDEVDPSAEGSHAELIETLGERGEWLPVLIVGDEEVVQKSFTAQGETKSEPGSQSAAAATVGGAAGGMFGGFGGAIGGAAPADERLLTAEWLEFEIMIPGLGSELHRRELFDFIGPKVRRDGTLEGAIDELRASPRLPFVSSVTELLAVPTLPSPEFVADLVARALLDNRDLVVRLASGEEGASVGVAAPYPGALYDLALSLRELGDGQSDLFADRLSLFALHRIAEVSGNGFAETSGFDVIADGTTGGSSADASAERLRRGVLLTNLEAVSIGEGEQLEDNTAVLLSAGGPQWLSLSGSPEDAERELSLSPDLIARLQADLAAGYTVVAPREPVLLDGRYGEAWWRIDPRNGTTLGIGWRGWGQATVEWDEIVQDVGTNVLCFLNTGLAWNSSSAAASAGELLLCAVGGGMNKAAWVAKGAGFRKVKNMYGLLTAFGTSAHAIAANIQGQSK